MTKLLAATKRRPSKPDDSPPTLKDFILTLCLIPAIVYFVWIVGGFFLGDRVRSSPPARQAFGKKDLPAWRKFVDENKRNEHDLGGNQAAEQGGRASGGQGHRWGGGGAIGGFHVHIDSAAVSKHARRDPSLMYSGHRRHLLGGGTWDGEDGEFNWGARSRFAANGGGWR